MPTQSNSSKTSISSLLICSSTTNTSVIRLTGGEDSANSINRLETVLQIMDEHFNAFYKDLLKLQKKRDFLLLSLNIVQHNDLLSIISPADRADIATYIQLINDQLASIELLASRTKRVDSLKRIDELFDSMLTMGDIIKSHKFCEIYLKACQSFPAISARHRSVSNIFTDCESSKGDHVELNTYKLLIQREFKALLIGCTEKERQDVYERLLAIQKHLKFQISKNLS